jgi:hypothetical protein
MRAALLPELCRTRRACSNSPTLAAARLLPPTCFMRWAKHPTATLKLNHSKCLTKASGPNCPAEHPRLRRPTPQANARRDRDRNVCAVRRFGAVVCSNLIGKLVSRASFEPCVWRRDLSISRTRSRTGWNSAGDRAGNRAREGRERPARRDRSAMLSNLPSVVFESRHQSLNVAVGAAITGTERAVRRRLQRRRATPRKKRRWRRARRPARLASRACPPAGLIRVVWNHPYLGPVVQLSEFPTAAR